MMPAAGHLEHMPAHILQRVGRYEEAAEANRRGAAADRAYFASTAAPDYYAMYLAHNYSFLAYSAAMEGRKAETLAPVQEVAGAVPRRMVLAMGDSGWNLTQQYAALVRFGLWDEMIALQPPMPAAAGLTAGYLYGRGLALAARGRIAEAQHALEAAAGARRRDSAETAGRLQHPAVTCWRWPSRSSRHASPPERRRCRTQCSCCARPWPPRTRWPTTSPRTGSSRCASCWVRSCSSPAQPAEAAAGLPRGPQAQPAQRLVAVRAVAGAGAPGRKPRRRRACAASSRPPGRTPMWQLPGSAFWYAGGGHRQLRVPARSASRPAGGWSASWCAARSWC